MYRGLNIHTLNILYVEDSVRSISHDVTYLSLELLVNNSGLFFFAASVLHTLCLILNQLIKCHVDDRYRRSNSFHNKSSCQNPHWLCSGTEGVGYMK